MSEGAPPTEPSIGLLARHIERETFVYDSFTDDLGGIRILRESAFHVRLSDREPITPVPHVFWTQIILTLRREHDGRQALGPDGTPYHVGSTLRAFEHPGSYDVGGSGWTDFAFPANATLPSENHCVASECIRHEGDALVIPGGFSIRMVIRLAPPETLADGVRATYDGTFENAADAAIGVLDEVNESAPVDIFNPLGMRNFDPVHNELERRMRDQNGDLVWQTLRCMGVPRSSWAWASTTSDSRLEVRTA